MFARLGRKANKLAAQGFPKILIRTVPDKIHTVLTDNSLPRARSGGVQFSDLARTGGQVMVHPFTKAGLGQRHRAPTDQALPSLDQPTGRANREHDQGRHRARLPRRHELGATTPDR
ncbi:MAG TPA: hypothetical protein VHL31_04475, partial [Geminicoccus sp.]|nr:hypothetical protein [Geminicoccus sp.]